MYIIISLISVCIFILVIIYMGVRPESFAFDTTDKSCSVAKGKIVSREIYGSFIAYSVKIGKDQYNIIDKHNSLYQIGDLADVYMNFLEINYFDVKNGKNLFYLRN